MAVNVVVALYYYLRWTAVLFTRADFPRTGEFEGPAVTKTRIPASLTTAIAVAAVVGLALSGAPQIVLRFTSGTLF
jgi:NADH-quinone oxidoreductase subunit N